MNQTLLEGLFFWEGGEKVFRPKTLMVAFPWLGFALSSRSPTQTLLVSGGFVNEADVSAKKSHGEGLTDTKVASTLQNMFRK